MNTESKKKEPEKSNNLNIFPLKCLYLRSGV